MDPFSSLRATTPSNLPWRSDLTSDLKSVTSIAYIYMCILLICFWPILRPFWWPQRSLQPPNGLRAQILTQIWNLGPKLLMQPFLYGLFRPSLEASLKIRKEDGSPLDLSALPQVKIYNLLDFQVRLEAFCSSDFWSTRSLAEGTARREQAAAMHEPAKLDLAVATIHASNAAIIEVGVSLILILSGKKACNYLVSQESATLDLIKKLNTIGIEQIMRLN